MYHFKFYLLFQLLLVDSSAKGIQAPNPSFEDELKKLRVKLKDELERSRDLQDTLVKVEHRVIILNRGSMFAFQWREFSPLLSSAHRLLQCYHSQWEIGDVAIPGEFPLSPRHYRAISQWASILEWRHAVTLHILVGKICIIFSLFYCEGMLSLVVLWLCEVELCLQSSVC